MANRDMLKEAIADAKALKETAIANAKAALEEAFEPRLKSMLSAKLQEMEDEDLNEVEEEMTEAKKEYKDDDRKDGGESKETKRTEKMKYGKDLAEGDLDEMDLDELLAELDEDARTDAEQEGYEDGMEDEKEDMEDMEDEDIDLEDMSEEDLKSFIEDVIADMVTSGELEAGEEFEVEDEVEDEEEIDVEDETEVDVTMNEVDGFNPTKTGDYELDRARAKGQLESKKDMEEGIADKLKAVWNDPEMLGKIITVDGEKMSLKDFLGMAGSAATAGMAKSGAGKTSSIGEDARTDAEEKGYLDGMKDEKEDMDDMKKEIEELRSNLHETNLLNAKLLYTNKIFRAKNLKEAQKVKVLEAFDKASNVKEVKLIFETLNEGMVANATTATPIRENLGRASKAAGMAPTKQPIMEIDPQVARWQKLAGIK
jgi:hypothetical protein